MTTAMVKEGSGDDVGWMKERKVEERKHDDAARSSP